MGLAASQARFLAITSRKMNCEFQSMQIAQQKLSVTRDLQKAAQDYQTDLTKTKLVWEGLDGDTYDLTYDMMMKPTAINQYDPYLVTDTQGRIVLTKALFNAAYEAGMIGADGSPTGGGAHPTEAGRNTFLEKLGLYNQIAGSTVSEIEALESAGYTRSGIGGEVVDKSISYALQTTAFINYTKTTTWEEYNKLNPGNAHSPAKDLMYSVYLDQASLASFSVNLQTTKDLDNDNQYVVTNNGQILSDDSLKKLTIGDILSGKYDITYRGADASNFMDAVLKQMAKVLGYDNSGIGLNVGVESDFALEQAFEFTKAQLNSTYTVSNGNIGTLMDEAQKRNKVIQGNDNKYCMSLTNILKSFLTNFAIAIDGFDCGFTINNDSVKDSNYVTSDLSYYFFLKNDSAQTDQTMLLADFYNMLYNQICMNGASTDTTKQELVNDKEYLAHALKNGQLFISSLNNDGYFYQGAYTLNGHVAEVPDEDAIAQAEIEYTVKKSKLNYKEETLEIQLKNLDTEISALTTEFDTVKNLISKSVEKVFTMFSS